MAEKHPFRSAFNGFHREDVVRYIEYLNSRHAAQVQQLQSENEQLRTQADSAKSAPRQDPLTLQMLARAESERDSLRTQVDQLQARCAELEAELDQAQQEAEVRISAAMGQVTDLRQNADRELEAYRRAERTERLARERAGQVYRQANEAIASASACVQSAADEVGGLADQVLSQLEQLRQAVSGSRDALCAAAETLRPIQPEED